MDMTAAPRLLYIHRMIDRIRRMHWRVCCRRASLIIDALTIENEELRARIAELEAERDAW